MQLKLERKISELNPQLTVAQVEQKALDISEYWIDSCLEDVLEADR